MDAPESSPLVPTGPSLSPAPDHSPPFTDNPRTPSPRLEPEPPEERIDELNREPGPPSQTEQPPPPPPPPTGAVGAYWATMGEDLSEPTGDELKEIEAADDDYSAHDYNHWEKSFYPELGDPDYRQVEKARLTWKFKGVRGNKDRPNRARIMRSPPAYVGGYWWTIKFLPRGNAVADLSLYVECSPNMPTPDKHLPETEFRVLRGPPHAVLADSTPDLDFRFGETDDSSQTWVDELKSCYAIASHECQEPSPTHGSTNRDWRVSAQLGVVMYNPQEPRTCSVDSASHQFTSCNADWGWTNFHGPWDRIHLRQKGQRQAMLRDDTLAFDVYIQVVDDPTLSLWWHPSDSEPDLDGQNLTGYWPMADSCLPDNCPEVAGLAAWIHLAPFRKIIQDVDVLEHLTGSNAKPKPICGELQWVLWQKHRSDEDGCRYLDTGDFSSRLHYMREFSDNVTEFWERLRRSLDLELAGTEAAGCLSSLFDSPSISFNASSSGPQRAVANTLPREYNSRIQVRVSEVESIQAALVQYLDLRQGRWALPPLLNVELYRHTLDKKSRQWRLLYDRVNLDEEVDLTPQVVDGQCGRYILYGYIVHRGSRTSGKYFSILRPGGPGTKWLAFDDSDHFNVRYLTRKMALDTHSGLDSSQLKYIDERAGHDVATAVLYVRADVVEEFLPGLPDAYDFPPTMQKYCRQRFGAREQPSSDDTADFNIQVEIYSMPHYDKLSSFLSTHDLLSQAHAVNHVMYLTVPRSTTFAELRRKIAISSTGRSEQPIYADRIRLWCIESVDWQCGPPTFTQVTDLRVTPSSRQSKVRLWMEVISEPDAEYFAMPDPPSHAATPDGKSEGAVAEREGSEDSGDRRPANEEVDGSHVDSSENIVQPSPTSNGAALEQPQSATRTFGNESTIEYLDPSHGHAVDSEPPPFSRRRSIGLPRTRFAEDETRNEPLMSPIAFPDQDESAVSDVPGEPRLKLPVPHVLYFLQIFDAENQALRTVGSFLSRTEDNVKPSILKHLGWPEDKDVRIWEDTLPSGVFLEIFERSFQVADGAVYIVGDRFSKEKCAELNGAGLFIEPQALLEYRWAELRNHPSFAFTGSRTDEASFGGGYYSGQFMKGYYHGKATHISNSGDLYVGDFVMGQRHGKGRIEYPSGDIYDGDWVDGNRHGQGTFIEKRTGNKYVGGYLDGKRHGKGITYWEVADEELDMCQICYGEGQDAMFYDCGHLCACMECAQQVDVCPICRKDIINVVRVYRI